MPHYTVVFGSDGPVIDLAVAASRSRHRRLASQGFVAPSPMPVRALIDTGSDISAVHPHVLQQFGVDETDSTRVRRPGVEGGFRVASLFDVRLSIGGLRPGALLGLDPGDRSGTLDARESWRWSVETFWSSARCSITGRGAS